MALHAHPHLPKPKTAFGNAMLSRFRSPSARLASQQGMSLIELLVVAAIISMMAGLLALGLKGMKAPAIQGAASQVTSGLSLARQLAISKNTKAALFVANDTANGRIPYRHWAVGYSNRLTASWTVAKKWEPLPEGAFFLETVSNLGYDAINKSPIARSQGGVFTPTSFAYTTNISIDSIPFTSLPFIMFSSDGAATTGNSATTLNNAAIRIASGAVDTNGQVTLTSTNQYYFVETDGIVGRIRMRAPESYK
jgi:prepilin-type N-terminal cleavage/methylation domain-containing protein